MNGIDMIKGKTIYRSGSLHKTPRFVQFVKTRQNQFYLFQEWLLGEPVNKTCMVGFQVGAGIVRA